MDQEGIWERSEKTVWQNLGGASMVRGTETRTILAVGRLRWVVVIEGLVKGDVERKGLIGRRKDGVVERGILGIQNAVKVRSWDENDVL